MDIDDWLKEYRRIRTELGISYESDKEARDVAAVLIADQKQPIDRLESLIRNRDVVIFGAGPSLEKGLQSSVFSLDRTADRRQKTLIAADGATSCLLENGVYPDVVVTDLDGYINDLLLADRFGAVMVVHAHGDNIPVVKKLLPKFKNPVITTQVEPLKNCHNFFGFTDGDRAWFLAKHFNARKIELVGFDFGETVGKYSDPGNPIDHEADEMKRKKLEIAKRLMNG